MDLKKININELVERLKSVQLSDINAQNIQDYIIEHKELTIKVVVILIGLVGSFYIYNMQMKKLSGLKAAVSTLKEKIEPAKALKSINSKVNDFYKSFPESLTDQEMITRLSNFAGEYNFQIDSLSSVNVLDKGFYDILEIKLMGSVSEFYSLAKFIHKVEYSDYAMRIKYLSAVPINTNKNVAESNLSTPMKVSITISVLKLRENEKNNKN